MRNRLVIHIQNLFYAIKWIFGDYKNFQKHLESKGYYSISFYKVWLWKKNALSFNDMTNISKKLRTKLEEHYSFNTLKTQLIQIIGFYKYMMPMLII